jgi:hypothetical protein
MNDTAPDVGEHEGSIPSYCYRLLVSFVSQLLSFQPHAPMAPQAVQNSQPSL